MSDDGGHAGVRQDGEEVCDDDDAGILTPLDNVHIGVVELWAVHGVDCDVVDDAHLVAMPNGQDALITTSTYLVNNESLQR